MKFSPSATVPRLSIIAKYVNMADVNSLPQFGPAATAAEKEALLVRAVELMFFAYRDFTSEPDAILASLDFGRAHHRVLHFVDRNPGLRVAELLEILKITKQSLSRVLNQLIDGGFIERTPGEVDRRERLLFTTPKGRDLAKRLLAPQLALLQRALPAGDADAERVFAFLAAMIRPEDRARAGRRTDPRRPGK